MKNKLKLIIPALIVIIVTLVIVLIPKNKELEKEDNIYDNLDFGDTNIIFNSSEVNYDNSDSELQSRTVQDVIDELYDSINNGCAGGYAKGAESGGTYTCNKRSSDALSTTVFDSVDVNYDNTNSGLTSENVEDAINELKEAIPDCKDSYTKTNITSNSYDCKKTITITANNQTITYGDSITQNVNQVTVTGLVTGDSLTNITLTPSTTEAPGGTITPSSAVIERNSINIASTYNINYETGTLTINKLDGYITLSENSGTYKYSFEVKFTITESHGGTISVNNDSCTLSGTTVTCTYLDAGTYTIIVTSGETSAYKAATATYELTVEKFEVRFSYSSKPISEGKPERIDVSGPSDFEGTAIARVYNRETSEYVGTYSAETTYSKAKVIIEGLTHGKYEAYISLVPLSGSKYANPNYYFMEGPPTEFTVSKSAPLE